MSKIGGLDVAMPCGCDDKRKCPQHLQAARYEHDTAAERHAFRRREIDSGRPNPHNRELAEKAA